jgi:RNA polymerase sigma-70 factor (ECF subfamily)
MALTGTRTTEERYEEAAASYGPALERLARAYEPDADRQRDLLQEIHIALWRSLAGFDGRCSLRTWVYRVAHNTATSQVLRRRAGAPTLVSLDEVASMPADERSESHADQQRAMKQVLGLIHALAPLDRQVILLYLEGMDAAAIGDVTGLSPGNVATKVHRIKKILSQRFHQGGRHGE